MAKNKVDSKNTLRYAVAFHFSTSGSINFMIGSKMYRHVDTVYDEQDASSSTNTLEIVYNYSSQKYEVLNVNTEIGNKEIRIL